MPSPQKKPHDPQSEHASAQQSAKSVHAASQKQPPGAGSLHDTAAAQPQSEGQSRSLSPTSHVPSPHVGITGGGVGQSPAHVDVLSPAWQVPSPQQGPEQSSPQLHELSPVSQVPLPQAGGIGHAPQSSEH